MSRLIKVIDNETIEIADYRNPEVIFKSSQNPPKLQDIKNEIEHLEWYCTFKDTINPFQMYEENIRLNNIINRIKSIYSSLCFSAPENNYIFIEQLGEILQELKGSDKEWKK